MRNPVMHVRDVATTLMDNALAEVSRTHFSPFQPWAGLRGTLVLSSSSRKWVMWEASH